VGGAVGEGYARGTERGGAGPLYPSQSSTGTVQWRSSGEEFRRPRCGSSGVAKGERERSSGAIYRGGLGVWEERERGGIDGERSQ
jgi:predicted RNA-binding Zn-ribbon protein involved in translation (DUF1610 family)